ncbi:Hypothetical protein SRAE_2000525100 [Strongyloides ratti]|uniref:Astacin-like metalloendopeptidase n=1 Tax=Strongyloides ratti TaxID=34506 RepID=A0A090LLM5_STRRB|nr:Hypothetical protein SRAE_2000525100 [Strongyloides ratti]CEF70626.2 Hypothetical protein SRAE_2000525100 [Strongyloides ratti]
MYKSNEIFSIFTKTYFLYMKKKITTNSKVIMISAFFFIILLNNYFTIEENITRKNFKRSVDQINTFVLNFPELTDSKINSRKKRKIITNPMSKWPLPIYYHYKSPINSMAIKSVITIIERETCIKFRKRKSSFFFYLVFVINIQENVQVL